MKDKVIIGDATLNLGDCLEILSTLGIEIEPKYFDIACRRIEVTYRQGGMFIEPPKVSKSDQPKFAL